VNTSKKKKIRGGKEGYGILKNVGVKRSQALEKVFYI
jgi:hypothetical protein